MKKLLLGTVLCLSTVLFVGCGSQGGSSEKSDESGQSDRGIESCDAYTKLMKCVIENTPLESKETVQNMYEFTIKQRDTIPKEQRSMVCKQTIQALESMKNEYKQLGCEL